MSDTPRTDACWEGTEQTVWGLCRQLERESAKVDAFEYRWRDANVTRPCDGDEVLLYHCLGDSRRGTHAYDVATYRAGEWIFPWDRAEMNPKPRWAIAWMKIPPYAG